MGKTAKEAGWHRSRYNIGAPIPDSDKYAIANLYKGTCGAYTTAELFLLDEIETLDEEHPIIEYFAERGLIANFDEKAALQTWTRVESGRAKNVTLTICPTLGCNFDCPYCFENHKSGKMTPQVQDDVIGLAKRLIDAGRPKYLHITWFGGEPLLAPEVIESLSERLMALAEENGIDYQAEIITNGYLLTQPIADMLGKYKVKRAQITLDGIGEMHDRTRHLAGGGPTYDRITENLRTLKLPFYVSLRHNVHSENKDQIEPLKALVKEIAEESGNEINYYNWYVFANDTAEERGSKVDLLCGEEAGDFNIPEDARRFHAGKGLFCCANHLFNIGIDDQGNLQKCWEDSDKPERSFGRASVWDPDRPIETADHPDKLTCYMNSCQPFDDEECMECIWLPSCAGGCPNKRLFNKKSCLPYKDHPEKFALELYHRLELQKEAKKEREKNEQEKEQGKEQEENV